VDARSRVGGGVQVLPGGRRHVRKGGYHADPDAPPFRRPAPPCRARPARRAEAPPRRPFVQAIAPRQRVRSTRT
jgi:hypothetical protein